MSARTNGTASNFMRRQGSPMVQIDADVLDIARRVQEGDELWRGDRSMELVYNDLTEKFEVLALDVKGQPYVVLQADDCDQRILMALAESDWTKGAAAKIDALVRNEERVQREQESAVADIRGALADKLAWGIKRAFAQHLGGKSETYSFNNGRR